MTLKYDSDGRDLMKNSRHSDAFLIEFPFIEPLQSTKKINSQFLFGDGGKFGTIDIQQPSKFFESVGLI